MKKLFMIFTLTLVLTGCADNAGPVVTHSVSGRVLYAGKPAEGVKVFLYPTSAPMIPQIPSNPHGTTGADGRFTITTYKEGDGAGEGGYQVLLLWPPTESEASENDDDRLLGWYTAVHSKLTAQIKAGDNVLPTFDLPMKTRPPEASAGIPGRN